MVYFPVSIMPKNLKRETVNEVDNSPNLFNARDFNIHHREIIAIEKFLVGDGIGTDNLGLLDLISQEIQLLKDISNNGLLSQFSGNIKSGETISFADRGDFHTALNVSFLADNATEIEVDSIDGFPESGYLTKFNSTKKIVDDTSYDFGISITDQEIISYTGVSAAEGINPAKFTGCTRGLEGTTAQDAETGASLIVGGKASLMLGIRSFKATTGTIPNQLYITHDAALKVTAAANDEDATAIDSLLEISYAMSIVGSFSDIRISQTLG